MTEQKEKQPQSAQELLQQYQINPPKADKERADLLQKIAQILKDNGGLESNVPLTSEYWGLTGQYRKLTNESEHKK